jgi:rubrerythrin
MTQPRSPADEFRRHMETAPPAHEGVWCPACGHLVRPTEDWTCPACGHNPGDAALLARPRQARE